jgi:TonB family protein
MKKLRAVVLSFVMAFFQVLPGPLWAQTPPPAPPPAPAPAPAPAANPVPAQPSYGTAGQPGWSASLSVDICRPVPLAGIPLTMDPPPEWRGRVVRMYADIRPDGTPSNVKLVGSSRNDALDQAAMAHVRQTARWAPLVCGRKSDGQDVSVSVPRATCVAQNGWRPPLPLALAQPRRGVNAEVMVTLAPGRPMEAAIHDSSGDAALDAALLAHVRQSWRFYPLAEGCGTVRERFHIVFPEKGCVPTPLVETQTLPSVVRKGPLVVTLQVGVAQDGKPLFANLIQTSGDAAIDAAAAAHVTQAWRWAPITCARVQPVLTDQIPPRMDTVRVEFP